MRKYKNITIFVLLFVLLFTLSVSADLKVHFIDVGQGDAILIQHSEGDTVLIDGGDRYYSVEKKLLTYLAEAGVEGIDAIIATHPHADHIGGLGTVIKEYPVGIIYDSGMPHTSKTYENYLLVIDEKGIPFKTPKRGDTIDLENLSFNIIHPAKDNESNNLNEASLVTYLEYGEISFIFTGDIEAPAENEIVNTGVNIDSTILKVGHHGSSTSTTDIFLEAVSPEISVITVGEDNRFGHPSFEVVSKLSDTSRVYRTDFNSDIIIKTDGKTYTVQPSILNINHATREQLEFLWGIGPATANSIIKYRERNDGFESVEEIKEVRGVGKYKFNKWKDKITVGG